MRRNVGQGIVAGLEKAAQHAGRASVWLGGIVMVFLVFFIVVHAGGRYFFHTPIKGFADIIDLSMIVIVFSSMAYVTLKGGNVEIELVTSRFEKHAREVNARIMLFIGVVITALLAWQGWVAASEVMSAGRSTVSLQIPHFPFFFLAALGLSVMCLGVLISFLCSFIKK
ncbi:MAG: TRAP transporter small permease [Chloroflexota bacterium]